ncbi:grancalcin isoform X2 [Rattus norvegicus]|uniref:grancalcin isoform X2 n=1 Tax=Rattus norvegicus TaxID=10116 RepID=UPI002FD7AE33
MAYPGYGGAFGNFGGQIPGMQVQMGQPVPGAGPNMFSGGYPGYLTYSDSYSPADDSMWTYFTAVAGQDGEVDAEELQRCLTQSGISGSYAPFSLETCRIMIAMLDRDYTGKMGFNEFKELWAALNAWKQNFMSIDQDQSGTVEHHELSQAIALMGTQKRASDSLELELLPECCVGHEWQQVLTNFKVERVHFRLV